jgi:mannosylglycerate hydrolase
MSASKQDPKRTGHIVTHTHWDREWRYPIWETRLMLIDFFDELIPLLEKGACPSFLLDGQTSPVYDYLEARPEMTDRVKALVAADKMLVGPWWTLPDEYPIDGEAMVRNLLVGTRRAKALGACFNTGYTSFGWGQTAQMPQLYAGFGLKIGFVGKHVGKQRAPHSEFIWQAPDGSRLLFSRFGKWGRHNLFLYLHLSALFGMDHMTSDWRYDWSNGGVCFHRADRDHMEQDFFRLDAPESWHPEIITPEMIETLWETAEESVIPDQRLMMNGCDYSAPQKFFPEMVKRINEIDPADDREWIETSMTDFMRIMEERIDLDKLEVVEGELRDGPVNALTGNALTTRLYVKRLNRKAQNLLIRFGEPLNALAAMHGAENQRYLLGEAWEHLLASHPHDSINGVTQDKTVEDVLYRLNQVAEIGQAVGNQSLKHLVTAIDMSGFKGDDVLVAVFNPLPHPRREVVEAYVGMPRKGSGFNWHEPVVPVRMYDENGKPMSTQWCGSESADYPVAELHTRTFVLPTDRTRLFFDTGEIPACGWKIFKAAPLDWKPGEETAYGDPWQRSDTLLKTPHVMENEYLRVSMNPNGTFDLTDKRQDRTYAGLNYFEDRGEIGDYWINQRPMKDQIHTSLGCAARIWAEESGPMQTTLVSEVTMRIPASASATDQARGGGLSDLTLRTAVTLRAGSEQVEVSVNFENRQEFHYLRVMFPTGITGATHADAAGHFAVDHRPIRPQGPAEGLVWPDMATLPQQNFVDVSDGKTGLAFLNNCLTEYEVTDNEERTVALSLLRAVKNWICTEMRVGSYFPSQKGGQSLGHHQVRYAIRPHAGDWQAASVDLAADQFNCPAIPVQTQPHKGDLPVQASLLAIDNPAVRFGALKSAEDRPDAYILRVYNPGPGTQKAAISLHAGLAKAWLVGLDEERISEISLKDKHTVPVTLGPYKIVNIELETA